MFQSRTLSWGLNYPYCEGLPYINVTNIWGLLGTELRLVCRGVCTFESEASLQSTAEIKVLL